MRSLCIGRVRRANRRLHSRGCGSRCGPARLGSSQVHTANTMKDNQKGIQEPVLTPGEAWHRGRMDALQVANRVLKKYARRQNVTLADVARAAERDMTELADEALLGYYESAGKVCTASEPPTVVFDPDMGVPLLVRP